MIKLDRNNVTIPFDLLPKIKNGNQELYDHFRTKNSQIRPPFRYNILSDFKPALLELSNHKCSFCESPFSSVSFGDVENFRPKSTYWWLTYEWSNLFAACQVCNQKYKKNLFPIAGKRAQSPKDSLEDEKALLINPANENPEDFFEYVFKESTREIHIIPKKGTDPKRALTTIDTFGLNRKSLLQQRFNTLQLIISFKSLKSSELGDEAKKNILNVMLDSIKDSAPYAGAARFFFKLEKFEGFKSHPSKLKSIDKKTDEHLVKQIHDNVKRTFKLAKEDPSAKVIPYISKISIRNFKAIKKFDFTLINPLISTKRVFQFNEDNSWPSEISKWTLILGENGVGKTAILEAIAIAVLGEEEAKKIHPVKKARNYINRDGGKCSITIEYLDGSKSSLRILKTKGIVFSEGANSQELLIRGFGHVRIPPRENDNNDIKHKLVEVNNLFDPYYSLCDVNKYFNELSTEVIEDIGTSPFFLVSRTIRDVLPEIGDDEIVKTEDGRIQLSIKDKSVFLDELSSGYQAVIILVIDIISAIKDKHLMDMREQPGIVLLDEIGSQLHPKWRMRIVRDLRKTFPKIQFIATTHEPLCIKSIATEEVIKMNHFETIALSKTNHPDIRKLRVDQLLTSPLFGLNSTIDPDIEHKFDTYYTYLQNPDENIEKIDELKTQLAKYNTLGYTRRDQLLYDIIDTYISKNSKLLDVTEIDDETRQKIINAWRYAKGIFHI